MTTPPPASPPPAVLPAAPSVPEPGLLHDPVRQARLLRDALQSDKTRVGCFLGAGCPLGIYDEKGENSIKLIPDVAKLTQDLYSELGTKDALLADAEKLKPRWDALVVACQQGGEANPNVEHLLTELRTITARKGDATLGTFTKADLAKLDQVVCDLIADAVGKPLPAYRSSYQRLASWIGGVQRTSPVDIFTPNYDLLIEEAFEQQRIPHFDGFVGSREPFFDIASIEQDAIPRRWARLWKLHGSINWQRRDDGGVFRVHGRAAAGKAMIYPSHLKYDQSRRMPYLAMIDRLRAFFRIGSHLHGFGPPVLVVCGYSFADDHLNEVLLEGLRGNQGAQCFVLAYCSLEDSKTVVKFATEQPNLTVLAYDGAVVGTRKGFYSDAPNVDAAAEPWIVRRTPTGATATTPATPSVQCKLGDFHFFGLFLEQLYGGRSDSDHVSPKP